MLMTSTIIDQRRLSMKARRDVGAALVAGSVAVICRNLAESTPLDRVLTVEGEASTGPNHRSARQA